MNFGTYLSQVAVHTILAFLVAVMLFAIIAALWAKFVDKDTKGMLFDLFVAFVLFVILTIVVVTTEVGHQWYIYVKRFIAT
jgi:K+-transporting ATPase A subunit